MLSLRDSLRDVLEEIQPATARQLFYQMVSRGLIPKTEQAYKSTVVRLLGIMRRSREIPFSWITDNIRWQRKPITWGSLSEMLEHTARFYRHSLWDTADAYVEIWLEKDALSGVLYPATAQWDVPLMVTRGYPSISFLHSAAEAIGDREKSTFLYYFGDYDPSGVDISRAVDSGIREFAPTADIHFQRVAVNREQIVAMNLPTRPTKKTDSRSKTFEGESVEVDAIEPGVLRSMTEDCILQHVDADEMGRLARVEEAEKQTLRNIAGYVGDLLE